MTLDQLPVNTPAVIDNVALSQEDTIRLTALGLMPGKTVMVLRTTSSAIHCRISTTEFIVRRSIAQHINLDV